MKKDPNLPPVPKDIQVMETLFSASCLVLFPSIGLYFSFLGVSDIAVLRKSYVFYFLTLMLCHVLAMASCALLSLLSMETFAIHKQLVCVLSVASTGSYVFLVVTLCLLRFVTTLPTFSSSLDLYVGVVLVLSLLVFYVNALTLIRRIRNNDRLEVLVQDVTIIALATYVVGILLQCAVGITVFPSAAIHVLMLIMLMQKHHSGRLLF